MSRAALWLTRQWMRRGWAARLLWPLHALMARLVRRRREDFLHGRRTVHDMGVPVLVVGNRVVGGAGKTPTVLAVLAHLRHRGWQPGVLSRGYGREAGNGAPLILNAVTQATLDARHVGDECWLIWRRARVPMGIDADRVAAGRALRAAHPEIDILVCDDGLQHWALRRDIEIVVFDERGVGNGWLLPAGLLREPVDAPPGPGCRQPALVLYNAEAPTTPLPGHCAAKGLRPLQAWADWARGAVPPPQTSPVPAALAQAAASDVVALAGIAQPERFFQALARWGMPFTPLPLPDHAPLRPLPWPASARHVVLTEKDAVKLDAASLARERPMTQVWVGALDFQPEPAFWQALDDRLAALPGGPRPAAAPPFL